MRPYPKLMCLKEAPDDFVVLFRLPTHGMVVHSEGARHPFGFIGLFNPEDFEDVADDVVIWLTEGPKDIIYEAIEVIEKLRSLKEATHQLPDPTSESQQSD